MFQSYNLFPHMTVMRNITLAPTKVLDLSAEDAKDRADQLLDRFGLADKADEYPDRLSGGQQQRVAIVRALAMQPDIMLLDEVTSALDPELVAEVLDVIRELATGGMTMLIATHEMGFARDIASRVCFLDEGVILEQGAPLQMFSGPAGRADRNGSCSASSTRAGCDEGRTRASFERCYRRSIARVDPPLVVGGASVGTGTSGVAARVCGVGVDRGAAPRDLGLGSDSTDVAAVVADRRLGGRPSLRPRRPEGPHPDRASRRHVVDDHAVRGRSVRAAERAARASRPAPRPTPGRSAPSRRPNNLIRTLVERWDGSAWPREEPERRVSPQAVS